MKQIYRLIINGGGSLVERNVSSYHDVNCVLSLIELFHYCSLIVVESMVQSEKGILTKPLNESILENSYVISNREKLNTRRVHNDTANCESWFLDVIEFKLNLLSLNCEKCLVLTHIPQEVDLL